tara:strand:- start:22 stop:183 length:162 start_codon:yes stop_codon:yes gene_type:complete
MAGHLKSEDTPNKKKKMMKRTKAMYGKEMRKKAASGRMMYGMGGEAMPKAKPN